MSLIPRLNKTEKEAFTVRLSRDTAEELRRYCQFLESPQDYVIGQALEMLFRKDKDFARWLGASASTGDGTTAQPGPLPATLPSAKGKKE
jgi:hypothetical protein